MVLSIYSSTFPIQALLLVALLNSLTHRSPAISSHQASIMRTRNHVARRLALHLLFLASQQTRRRCSTHDKLKTVQCHSFMWTPFSTQL
ncbi:hypothetical protein BJX66DRAFT_62946 [Aspergillus keveii]|uniref:Secreted protein n=1 Tax=Aspergillus keveii TaxID=714993 RepID=A0ABR4GGG0_9EURO